MTASEKARVLLADDEASIRETVQIFLELSGFEVLTATNGAEALEVAAEQQPDLIVLDVLMPMVDGREALRRLRAGGDWTPVILLTQLPGAAQRIMAIEEGADDYLNKPFDPQELVARIRAVLRRTHAGRQPLHATRRLRSGPLSLDRSARRAFLDNRELPLTPKSISILEHLMTHPRELVTRERLLDVVWGWESGVGERAVDTRIAELRRALGDDPAAPTYIETVPNAGYRFVAPVEGA
ncbi:MAG: response regulator transcription factor [Candidatus Promineifilaceae bacterium]|nr:response regulator transcription factor [Candidatus Promineifilaceae bacterium]